MRTKRHCLNLELKDDKELIREYRKHHDNIWPDVRKSILDSGIVDMEIYLSGNRLFMIMEVDEAFTFERKSLLDSQNPVVGQWEELMWKYQQALPGSKPGEKWRLMERIFFL